jgi:hypothetical protein
MSLTRLPPCGVEARESEEPIVRYYDLGRLQSIVVSPGFHVWSVCLGSTNDQGLRAAVFATREAAEQWADEVASLAQIELRA